MIDPRIHMINKRLQGIAVYPIASSKGGVGKSLISVLLSLGLRDKGIKVGLLDIDFTNPSCHIILGVDPGNYLPREEYGIVPPEINGLSFMSIFFYTRDRPIALRGDAIDNAIKELLVITRWKDINALIIDTPPGLSDEFLDLITLIQNLNIILVTTPHILSLKSVERMIKLLRENSLNPLGLIENMADDTGRVKKFADNNKVLYLGGIPYIENLESIFNQGGIGIVYKGLKRYIDNILEGVE